MMLTQDQQDFVDSFYDSVASELPTKDELKESIQRIRTAINNIDFETDFIDEIID
jgi:hypothetical protein